MKPETEGGRTIRVRWKRSAIGRPEPQKRILRALGFKRLNQIRQLPDHPTIRGMVQQIPHLVEVIEEEGNRR